MSNITNKRIDAVDKTLTDILANKKYSIDYFQREYRWGKENMDQMIDDLHSAFLDNYKEGDVNESVASYSTYFMGSIVLIAKDDGTFSLIDGQQRITSLTLLLIYLNSLVGGSEEINPLIYSSKYGKKSYNLQVEEREKCLDSLYTSGTYQPKEDDSDSVKNMAERYNDIVEDFPDDLKEEGKREVFMYWVLNNIILVRIQAYSEENAYTIFETMNDRGLNLTNSDMLKGFILSKYSNEDKRNKANDQWKSDMQKLLSYGKDGDNDFFRAWMRAQFAETKRQSKAGSSNEDFENIGVRFHSWFRDNYQRGPLKVAINGNMENFMERNYRFFFNRFCQIKEAEKHLEPGLEWVYYIQFRGISPYLAYPMMLAPLQITDDETTYKKKMNLVARYIDSFVVHRQVNFRSYVASSIAYTMFNIIKSLRNKNCEEILYILRERKEEGMDFDQGMNELRLHGQNGPFIKYFLSRITSFVEEQSGKGNHFVSYMTNPEGKPYDIEHIWSNHFDRHTDTFQHPEDFERFRNKIGDLILLTSSTNRSYGDDDEDDVKIPQYIKENLLAQSLCKDAYINNPGFTNFIAKNNLNFKSYSKFDKEAIEDRCKLYAQIAKLIWEF